MLQSLVEKVSSREESFQKVSVSATRGWGWGECSLCFLLHLSPCPSCWLSGQNLVLSTSPERASWRRTCTGRRGTRQNYPERISWNDMTQCTGWGRGHWANHVSRSWATFWLPAPLKTIKELQKTSQLCASQPGVRSANICNIVRRENFFKITSQVEAICLQCFVMASRESVCGVEKSIKCPPSLPPRKTCGSIIKKPVKATGDYLST